METYVLMTKLGSSALEGTEGRRRTGQVFKQKVESLCPGIKWIAHYALLGPYDFMDIYEAPDQATAFQVSLVSREAGAVSAESWPAISYTAYVALAEKVESKA